MNNRRELISLEEIEFVNRNNKRYCIEIDADQVHDMYVRKVMELVDSCQYAEFNGKPLIGAGPLKIDFKLELQAGLFIYTEESENHFKAKTFDGRTYFFSKGVADV